MTISQATVTTTNASRYLQQLCKHWSHKFQVEFTPSNGTIVFTDGRVVTLKAEPDTLLLHAEAEDAEALQRLEQVVEEHIVRFAFRETLVFAWSPESARNS